MESRTTVSVVAPMDLPGGYTFDATINLKTIKVVVPECGVAEGDTIRINVKKNDDEEVVNIAVLAKILDEKEKEEDEKKNLLKRWRFGICSFYDIFCTPLFWASLFCPWILLGQLMQRYKLNFWGYREDVQYNTFMAVSMFGYVTILIEGPLLLVYFLVERDIYLYFALGVFTYSAMMFMYWSLVLRKTAREDYALSTKCGCFDDCCVTTLCNCCSLIQISRHSHNEKIFPYKIDSETGLPFRLASKSSIQIVK